MPLKTYQDEQPVLNLTPMIDVLFLLIIFFMVGTRFAGNEKKIELQLPTVGNVAALSSAPQTRVIHVMRDGSVKLDATDVTLPQLSQQLASSLEENPRVSITIRADAKGEFQNVAAAMAACRSAGIRDMAISVKIGEMAAAAQPVAR